MGGIGTAIFGPLLLQGAVDEFRHLFIIVGAGPSRAKLVMQSLNAAFEKPPAPLAHRRGRDGQALGDGRIGQPLRTGQNDAGALDQTVGHRGGLGQGGQLFARSDWRFPYLQTGGGVDIDLIIERPGLPTALIEIKSSKWVDERDVRSLVRFTGTSPSRWPFASVVIRRACRSTASSACTGAKRSRHCH